MSARGDAPNSEQGSALPDLQAVHAFYLALLDEQTGGRPPVPAEVCGENEPGAKVQALKQWLGLLDLAIRFPMLRDGMTSDVPRETAAALLRYFANKEQPQEGDRDKVDFIATWLYRSSDIAASTLQDSSMKTTAFERELGELMGDQFPPLPPELGHLVKEFEFFSQEVAEFRTFDQITDSDIVQRVRAIKECFGKAFYHPRVLAAVATHNAFFRERFDALFGQAVEEIRNFAQQVLEAGASVMTRVAGEVRVKHLTEVEDEKLLRKEYVRAQLEFRKLSQFRKAVDDQKRAGSGSSGQRRLGEQGLTAGQYLEEAKIRGAEDMVRLYLEAAGGLECHAVPMAFGNLPLSGAELDSYRRPHKEEKSFRAAFAALLRRIVALNARMRNQLAEYWQKRKTQYLWKPHADALAYLLAAGNRAMETSFELRRTAEERGLGQKIKELEISIDRMRAQMAQVAQALQG